LKVVIEGVEKAGGIFHPQKFGNVFGCSTTTRSSMGKRRPQKDSAHQIVPEIPIHGILMVVVSCCTGREDVWAEFFTLEMFWPAWQQPAELWTNGCCSWIQ
jgi:hypothetical protein